jgi:hypothetical protein
VVTPVDGLREEFVDVYLVVEAAQGAGDEPIGEGLDIAGLEGESAILRDAELGGVAAVANVPFRALFIQVQLLFQSADVVLEALVDVVALSQLILQVLDASLLVVREVVLPLEFLHSGMEGLGCGGFGSFDDADGPPTVVFRRLTEPELAVTEPVLADPVSLPSRAERLH